MQPVAELWPVLCHNAKLSSILNNTASLKVLPSMEGWLLKLATGMLTLAAAAMRELAFRLWQAEYSSALRFTLCLTRCFELQDWFNPFATQDVYIKGCIWKSLTTLVTTFGTPLPWINHLNRLQGWGSHTVFFFLSVPSYSLTQMYPQVLKLWHRMTQHGSVLNSTNIMEKVPLKVKVLLLKLAGKKMFFQRGY